MIVGIGNDIIEIARIEKAIQRHKEPLLERLFTQKERAYCAKYAEPARHYAGRFAAKEAIVKALGTGFRGGISWQDIEILNDPQGKPIATLSQNLQEHFPNLAILISISHNHHSAIATAIAVNVHQG